MKHQREIEWTKLENASKIFPATWNMKDPKVFRLTCELYETVHPDCLQEALEQILDDFPLYQSVLRKGLFWYYFENSNIEPKVHLESTSVCAPIYVGLRNNLLFRVSYYRNRINLEVFHALSDGTGALRFLQALVSQYLVYRYKDKFANVVLTNGNSSIREKMDDSFEKHFIGRKQKNLKKKHSHASAYQIHGTRFADNQICLIEGSMSAEAILHEAHQYHTTLSAFLASVFIYAVGKQMPARKIKHPVGLTVPVNLRQYFESVTARNFFSYFNIFYRVEKDNHNLQSVIQSVSESFQRDLTVDQLKDQLNKYISIERNVFARIVPLPIKDFLIRLIVNRTAKQTSSSISNIGKISMPKEFHSVIRQFSASTSAKRPQMTLCSYDDRLVVTICSPYRETDIQRTFFQSLSKLGIEIELSSNF